MTPGATLCTAAIDVPAALVEVCSVFWAEVAGPTCFQAPSRETRGPVEADAQLVISPGATGPRIRPHLHAAEVDQIRDRAAHLGATTIDTDGELLRSPGGLVFSLAQDDGRAAAPGVASRPCIVDQVCLDLPARRFEHEASFWETLTGWERRSGRLKEFTVLAPPRAGSMRILLQRLGEPAGVVRAHLDLAAGELVREMTEHHVELGAVVVRVYELWTTLTDPTGMAYCLTARRPPP